VARPDALTQPTASALQLTQKGRGMTRAMPQLLHFCRTSSWRRAASQNGALSGSPKAGLLTLLTGQHRGGGGAKGLAAYPVNDADPRALDLPGTGLPPKLPYRLDQEQQTQHSRVAV